MTMELHLGGHLAFYGPGRQKLVVIRLEGETPLVEVLGRLAIPEADVAVAAVNLNVVSLHDARVVDGDRVDLYPPISGG
jgi:sulfur carrier protein ThiS